MNIYSVEFAPIYPVPCYCVVAANSRKGALKLAMEKITHTNITIDNVHKLDISNPKVLLFNRGDY